MYKLRSRIAAVKLAETECGGRNGVISPIPEGSTLQLCGPSRLQNDMIEVLWNDAKYALFAQDLLAHSEAA